MLKASYRSHVLRFKRPAGTSRGVLHEKPTWFITLERGGDKGIGECGLIPGLSLEDRAGLEDKLRWVCEHIHLGRASLEQALPDFPAIRFGLETAFKSLGALHPMDLFPSSFTRGQAGIAINGLIWMGDIDFMRAQLRARIEAGFRCIKLKVGSLDFELECGMLRELRRTFSPEVLELRLDANGAFSFGEALRKLAVLSRFHVHSIEQPLEAGRWEQMAQLCAQTPLPVALDEELIGTHSAQGKAALLDQLKPQYLVLKPGLLGGFSACEDWIRQAEQRQIGWWVTSALESNVGLNAIAQWTYTLHKPLPQGLGTGSLFRNNIPSPLRVSQGRLYLVPEQHWELDKCALDVF